MKNKMIALSLFLASVLTVNAQQERVSKQLYTSAYKIATDSKEDVNVRKAASRSEEHKSELQSQR